MSSSPYIESLRKKHQEFSVEKAAVEARIAKDQARLNDLLGAISGIETLLRVEGAAPFPQVIPAPASANGEAAVLSDVLKEAVITAKPKPFDLTELVGVALSKGVDFGSKNPHRAVGFTLLGIAKGKTIERMNDGRWRAT